MNWIEAAEAAPSIVAKDIVHLTTSAEETDQLIALYEGHWLMRDQTVPILP